MHCRFFNFIKPAICGGCVKKRMLKDQRREQLLEVACEIVREAGTDALTLNTLAQRAGVTKPLTYRHFATRQGLLAQMYRHYDNLFVEAVKQAAAEQKASLAELCTLVCRAYLDCAVRCGPEYEAIVAALRGYPEYQNITTDIRDFFTDFYSELFADYLKQPAPHSKLLCWAIHGAINEVANAVACGHAQPQEATTRLSQLLQRMLGADGG